MSIRLALIGRVFGRLTVVRFAGIKKGASTWRCLCECGNGTTVLGSNLTHSTHGTKSCGCLAIETARQQQKDSKVPLAVRFWRHVDKRGPKVSKQAAQVHPEISNTKCWVWTANRLEGYGLLVEKGEGKHKSLRAPRVAWLLATGEWPKDHALHKCDNPSCVRFLHLFDGTNADNILDRMRKGRGKRAKH